MSASTTAPPPGLRRRKEEEVEEADEEAKNGKPPTSPAPPSPFASAQPGLFARAWATYTSALAAHPLRTRALTAGTIACAADALAQALAAAPPPPVPLTSRRGGGPLRGWRRSAAWFAWGAAVSGPAGHAWQGVLDSVWPPKKGDGTQPPPPPTTAVVAARVAADAAVFSPAINALALTFITLVIERSAPSKAPSTVKSRFWATQTASWRLWPAASAVAYAAVPPRLRVLFFNAPPPPVTELGAMRRPTSAAAAREAANHLSSALVDTGVEARPLSGRRLRRVATGASGCHLAGGEAKDGAAFKSIQNRLIAGLVIATLFMLVEAVGGFLAHSIAIWTDAAHLLSDVSGFAVALIAARVAARAAAADHTFGYHRIEVLGALASVAMTWFVTGILVIEAAGRVAHPKPVDGRLMFILAAVGVGVNLLLMVVLGGHHHYGPGGGHDHDHGHGHGGGECGGHGHGHSHPPAAAASVRHSQPGDELAPVCGSGSGGAGGASTSGAEDPSSAGDVEKGPAVPVLALARPSEAAAPAAGGGGAPAAVPSAAHAHGHGHGHDHGDAHRHSINVRGAVLHVIGDMVQSVGVAIAGALIWGLQDRVPRIVLADPICTFLFALLVLLTTRAILKDIFDILMERAPRGLAPAAVEAALAAAPGVAAVSDLHLWVLKPSVVMATAHVTPSPGSEPGAVLAAAKAALAGLGITHVTVQVDEEEEGEGAGLLSARSGGGG